MVSGQFFQIFNFNIKMNQQNSILANKISSCKGLFQDKTVFARKSHERVDNQITRDKIFLKNFPFQPPYFSIQREERICSSITMAINNWCVFFVCLFFCFFVFVLPVYVIMCLILWAEDTS